MDTINRFPFCCAWLIVAIASSLLIACGGNDEVNPNAIVVAPEKPTVSLPDEFEEITHSQSSYTNAVAWEMQRTGWYTHKTEQGFITLRRKKSVAERYRVAEEAQDAAAAAAKQRDEIAAAQEATRKKEHAKLLAAGDRQSQILINTFRRLKLRAWSDLSVSEKSDFLRGRDEAELTYHYLAGQPGGFDSLSPQDRVEYLRLRDDLHSEGIKTE